MEKIIKVNVREKSGKIFSNKTLLSKYHEGEFLSKRGMNTKLRLGSFQEYLFSKRLDIRQEKDVTTSTQVYMHHYNHIN